MRNFLITCLTLSAFSLSTFASSDEVVTFKVAKMSCKSCAMKIKKALKTDLGLDQVDIDVETKTVKTTCPAATCSLEKITQSLDKIGYPIQSSL